MYYLVFGIIAIICICGLVGLRRGLFKTLFGFIALILSIFVAYYVNPYVTDYVVENTEFSSAAEEKIYNRLQKDMEKKMKQSLEDAGMPGDLEKMSKEETAKLMEEQPDKATQMEMIRYMKLPQVLKDKIIENNNEGMYSKLNVTGFYRYMSAYLTKIIMNVIGSAGTYLAIQFVLLIICWILGAAVKEVPILTGIDKLGGIILGAVVGLAIIWIFMAIAFCALRGSYSEMIGDNPILTLLDKNNVFIKLLTNIK